MHRSYSSSIVRASDELSVNISATLLEMATNSNGYLPINRSVFDGSKKEIPVHGKSSSTGQKAIHLIPVVLIFCGLVLWIFSHP